MDDPNDVLERLAGSPFRRRFKLSDDDIAYVRRRGWATLGRHAERFVTERLAAPRPANDGRQTPMRGHPVFVAQHATATCCRKCLAKWHGIPADEALSVSDIHYIVKVIEAWLSRRVPGGAAEDGGTDRHQLRLF